MKISQAMVVDEVQRVLDTHTKSEIKQVIGVYFESVANMLAEDALAVATPLGTFKKVGRKGRKGINPLTGKPMNTPDSTSVVFKPSKQFKIDLN
jgi:DNA-binding protein HU-beta